MPLVDVVGKIGAALPAQNGAIGLKVGVTAGFTVTLIDVVDPHCPGFGVNVYVPDAVLLTVAGLHVPVTPLSDVVGNAGGVDPAQIGPIGVNCGVAF